MTDLSPADLGRALAARRKQRQGACVRCGAPFVGTGKRRYCSRRCATIAAKAAQRARRRTPAPVPELPAGG